jgi:hypothetical protein
VAVLARRGVLLVRVVQAVNLHTLRLPSSPKSSKAGFSGGGERLTGERVGSPSRSGSGGGSASGARDKLAAGGGSFRVCVVLPDGGVGGCGDAWASSWRAAGLPPPCAATSDPTRRPQSPPSEASAAAHVLWNGAAVADPNALARVWLLMIVQNLS